MSRESTNRLLELIEEGMLNRDTVIMACVKYMSEDDVADMCHCNEFFEEPEPEYCNYYHCPDCNEYWDDIADSKCDDECPKCETPYTPIRSEEL